MMVAFMRFTIWLCKNRNKCRTWKKLPYFCSPLQNTIQWKAYTPSFYSSFQMSSWLLHGTDSWNCSKSYPHRKTGHCFWSSSCHGASPCSNIRLWFQPTASEPCKTEAHSTLFNWKSYKKPFRWRCSLSSSSRCSRQRPSVGTTSFHLSLLSLLCFLPSKSSFLLRLKEKCMIFADWKRHY